MKVLVTGGNGFIGHYVVRQLAQQGVDAVSFNRMLPPKHLEDVTGKVRFATGDVVNPFDVVRVIKQEGVQRIIHLAGLGGPVCQANPALAYHTNITGASNLLEAARIMGVERVVYASSASAYGSVSGEWLTEDSPKNPISVYGMTKLAVEHLGFTYAENWGLDFVAVRPCAGLGPYRRGGGGMKLSEVVRLAVEGLPVRMRGGDQTYEMVHAWDSAKAFVLAATKDQVKHKAFHIGLGKRASLLQLAAMVKEAIPEADIEIEPGLDRKGSDRTRTDQPPMDTTRAREEGWTPDYTLEMAVQDLIRTYQELKSKAS